MQKKKLSIAIVTNNYTPYSGGLVSSINSFVHELHKQGHKAFIITLDFLGNVHKDPYYVIRIPSNFRFNYKENPMAIPLSMTKKLESVIQLLKPDIIHAQHPFFICQSALKVARKLNIPILFTYHTIYEQYLHYVPAPKIISRPIVKQIVLSFCKRVDTVIVPSTYIEHYLRINKIETTINKIPSGILPIFAREELYQPVMPASTGDTHNHTSEHLKPMTANRPFSLLFVSRFVKEKNIIFLLELFKKLITSINSMNHMNNNKEQLFTFTLAGYGTEYETIKKYALRKLKLGDFVTFVHKPTKQELADLYLQADLFLFSSTSDTQGLVLAEAMASGCPVVSLNGPGQSDIIQNEYNGFLCDSETEMLEKIRFIAQNKQFYAQLRNNAFETAKRYHPAHTTNQLIAIYEKLFGTSSNKASQR